MPTYLNQFGLQSSLNKNRSPSVNCPVLHPLHFGELGQLKYGMCWYPISRNLFSACQHPSLAIFRNLTDVPVDLALVLKQSQRDAMYRRITPSLVKEASGTVEILKIILVRFAAPEVHVGNLEVAPEVTRAIPIRLLVMTRPPLRILHPISRIVLVQVFRMLCYELLCRRVQSGNRWWRIVEVDRESIRFIVVLHPTEDIIVNVTKEMYFWFDTPVIASIRQRGMFVEHAAVPAAHLVVADQMTVLHVLLIQDISGFIEEVTVDPGGNSPMLFRDKF